MRWLDLQDIVGSIDEENEGEEEEAEDQPDDGAKEGVDQTTKEQVLLIMNNSAKIISQELNIRLLE